MATVWGKPGTGGGGFAAALGQQLSVMDAASRKFAQQYGKTPLDYVNTARAADKGTQKAEVSKMGTGGTRYNERSNQGKYWTENTSPTDSPSKDVVAYHQAEDSAKSLASAGKLDDAVTKVDEAIRLRERYEQRIGRTDTGHTQAITMLRARRNSMSNLFANAGTNAKETAAITLVRTFYTAEGLTPPSL